VSKPKIMGALSCPRLGFMDFMGASLVAFLENGVPLRLLYGAFWDQALYGGITQAIKDGYDYIITTDYDTVYSEAEVKKLIDLAIANPEADAICAMQMGRFSGLLASTDSGCIEHKQFEDDLVPINTGHFGLTIIKLSALNDLPKPWFLGVPNSEGGWEPKTDKVDPDIYFWQNFQKHGRKLFLASRIVVGHLELLVKFPDVRMDGIYQTTAHYNEFGPPADVWK